MHICTVPSLPFSFLFSSFLSIATIYWSGFLLGCTNTSFRVLYSYRIHVVTVFNLSYYVIIFQKLLVLLYRTYTRIHVRAS